MVANAQSNIKSTTLKIMKTWKKLLMREIEEINKQKRAVEVDIEEAVIILRKIPRCDCDNDNILQWFSVR